MRSNPLFFNRLLGCLAVLLLAGCVLPAPAPSTATPTAIPSPSPSLTLTLPPTLTPAPAPSLTPAPSPTASGLPQNLLAGYFYAGFASRGSRIENLPFDQLDVLIYAFLTLSPSGECISVKPGDDAANFAALKQVRRDHPRLKTLVSVGGASDSTLFSDIAAAAETRARFAQSCAQFMKSNNFDGIDVDWEFPVSGGAAGVHHSPADKQNFTALLAALRAELDARGKADQAHYYLTLAGPVGASQMANIEIGPLSASLDWINLMTYSYAWAGIPLTNFMAPLYPNPADPSPAKLKNNADAAIKAYLAAGVPAKKLVLGAALYGRGWQGVANINNGLYQPHSGPSQGTWSKNGVYNYSDLAGNVLATSTRSFQADALVPWLYSPGAQVFITYEDPQSLAAKAGYVVANGLGGMMVWELSYDDARHSLIGAIYSRLHP